jgi:3-methylcrotonyl-CoA carboxylase alpha subunit
VHLVAQAADVFDITVRTSAGDTTYTGVRAQLAGPTTLTTVLGEQALRTTVVPQLPTPGVPASDSPATMQRLHVFHAGRRTTLVRPSSSWLRALGADVAQASGALRAPMPSLVVEVRVNVGDRVEEGQAVVVLESMKTETVLRAGKAGVVKAVGCKKGEMVEEGRELVDIEDEEKV